MFLSSFFFRIWQLSYIQIDVSKKWPQETLRNQISNIRKFGEVQILGFLPEIHLYLLGLLK